MATISEIAPGQAAALVKENKGMFVDVRSVGEALGEQVPGSIFLPFDLVSKQRLEVLGIGNKTPVLVCRSGSRAKQAAAALAQEMESVAVLDGGLVSWKEAGLPIDQGRKGIPLERQVLVGAGSMMMLFTLLGLVISPGFFALTLFMAGGMIFAGATGACGMARILVMMPWNRAPLCGSGCAVADRQ